MSDARAGAWFAVAAYGFWGIAPIYFKWVQFASPVEVVAHRIVWSVPLLAGLILLRGQVAAVRALDLRAIRGLALCGIFLSVNWGVYVWALFNDRLLEASLGYFINPLVTVLLGVAFLRESLRPLQLGAVALAAIGVANEVIAVGVLPIVALSLAFSFGFYGLVRKKLGVDSAAGLGAETTLLLPFALGFLFYQASQNNGSLSRGDPAELLLLAAGGLVTVFPLVCFAAAALKLPLSTLGFFQYLAPSIMFVLAIFVYGELFRLTQGVTFAFIWLAVLVFSAESYYMQRRRRCARPAP